MQSSLPPSAERQAALDQLLARVALGDRAAFGTLYKSTSAHLFAVVLRICTDRAQAEDLLQDIYVNVWRAAGSFDAACAQPMTWLVSIARNRAIDALRRRRTAVQTVSAQSVHEGEDERELVDDVASPDPGPLELLSRALEARSVGQCMGELPRAQQHCLSLAYYQGLSHSEVATHLSQPLGTVKSWVRRSLAALKECLARVEGAV